MGESDEHEANNNNNNNVHTSTGGSVFLFLQNEWAK